MEHPGGTEALNIEDWVNILYKDPRENHCDALPWNPGGGGPIPGGGKGGPPGGPIAPGGGGGRPPGPEGGGKGGRATKRSL